MSRGKSSGKVSGGMWKVSRGKVGKGEWGKCGNGGEYRK